MKKEEEEVGSSLALKFQKLSHFTNTPFQPVVITKISLTYCLPSSTQPSLTQPSLTQPSVTQPSVSPDRV